jgi:hypothetical protein
VQSPEASRDEEEARLLANIVANLPSVEAALQHCIDHWGYEDPVYRFYHQSFKVFALQQTTQDIMQKLQALAFSRSLDRWFLEIVRQGTGKEFSPEDNQNWTSVTRPIVEAFFHARFFLEMVCKYGKELKTPLRALPSGWAAVLCLYNLR